MITLNLNLGPMVELNNSLKGRLDTALKNAAQQLAMQSHAHLMEEVNQKLHSTRQKYVDAVSFTQVNDTTWVISLDRSAMWIEEGMCVLYGAERTAPNVLTPDGPIPCTKIKVGSLVLNENGQWTRVLSVHNRHLLERWKERVVDDSLFKALSRRSHKPIDVQCPSCMSVRSIPKYDFVRKGYTICPICPKPVPVRLYIPNDNGYSLWLTPDHQVKTPSGWVKAEDLPADAQILAPYWGKCKGCSDKTLWGRDWCSSGCATRSSNYRRLAAGTHPSQDPDWLANVYRKVVAKGGRVSGAEDICADLLTHELGCSVAWSGDLEQADWIRQYRFPKGKSSKGGQTYYFGDFVNTKLKLVVEVDGSAFHSTQKDQERDRHLLSLGYQTIRIPAKLFYSNRGKAVETLKAVLANHTHDIEYRPLNVKIERIPVTDGFSYVNRWDITVAEGSSFVCQGLLIHNSEHEMLDNLLKSPKAKMAKDGSRYLVVPFQHNKGPTSQTRAAQDLTATVKQELKKRQIPYSKIERDQHGKAKLGLLHSFDITKEPVKTHEGAGQGHGKIGDVRQGTTGIPFLQSVRIYQRQMKDGSVNRGIMTFRVASSKHKGTGKWVHPGLQPRKFFDETADWALKTWTTMRDEILKEFADF